MTGNASNVRLPHLDSQLLAVQSAALHIAPTKKIQRVATKQMCEGKATTKRTATTRRRREEGAELATNSLDLRIWHIIILAIIWPDQNAMHQWPPRGQQQQRIESREQGAESGG